ncbi:MAG: hypothetical protein DWG76_04550 [Chloroflexi bacterium]|nr:hypothetical protein [Chloroflexota bacterium]
MSRVINPDGVGKQRKRYLRAIAISLREMVTSSGDSAAARDLVAFIVLTLEAVAETIDRTVEPWEKRDYWLKADRFRMDWAWAARLAEQLRQALIDDDWGEIAAVSAQIVAKLSTEKVPQRHRLGTPWVGAWEKFQQMQRSN